MSVIRWARSGEPEERLLHEVLGGVTVVDEQAGEPHQRPALLLEQPDDELLGRRRDLLAVDAGRQDRRLQRDGEDVHEALGETIGMFTGSR